MSSPNPYLDARQEWLERYGSYIASRSRWRLTAICCLLIAALAVAGNVIQSLQFKVVPFIVETDKLGEVRAVSRADEMRRVPDRVVQTALARYVVSWRTVTPDQGLQRRMLSEVSAYTAAAATGALREWYEANNPYERNKDQIVEVDIQSLPLPVGDQSWRIEWTETTRNYSGTILDRTRYAATVVVETIPPTTDQDIMSNPTGTFVTTISYSKLLGKEEK